MNEEQLRGKVALVTGSTSGIGKETARKLARAGAKVLLHGRDRAKAEAVADELRAETGNLGIDLLVADFASLTQVRQLAEEVRRTYPNLQLLINNAGEFSPVKRITEDGFERTFQIQYLAPFVLTNSLLDLLEGIRPSRILNVTSVLHKGASLDMNRMSGIGPYDGRAAYASSKLALTLYTFELARRSFVPGISIHCLHPGGVDTRLKREGYGGGGMSPSEGAWAPFLAASAEEAGRLSGRYYERGGGVGPRARIVEALPDARAFDAGLRRRIWDETETLLAGRLIRRAS